jgi:hypothetical protein
MAHEELRRGDLVEVLGPAEILATLDERGALGGLPFMPEMAAFCGRRLLVDRRADRVCDTVRYSGIRQVPDGVFLGELRCNGSAHGGCQADCRVVWKADWLRRVTPDTPPPALFARRDLDALVERCSRDVKSTVEEKGKTRERWWCQATELPAASRHIKLMDAGSYVNEYRTGNVGLGHFLRVMTRVVVQEPMRKLGLIPEIHLPGTASAPAADPPLNLQPGELVQIKSKEEIATTLTPDGRHRGMWFDREMMPYCGGTYRVRQRVRRFIHDGDGRMIEFKKNACVTLEDVVCSGDRSLCRWFCPRAIYPYWSECWLRRVDSAAQPAPPRAGAAV